MIIPALRLSLAVAITLVGIETADAQVLGIFRWQMQPHCNVVTLTVAQQGAAYLLNGSDDMCGAGPRAAATGTAVQNPDGTIAMGLTIVTPSGAAAHVNAAINLATISGTWTDADGGSGTFLFNPGAASGSPRPAPG